MLALPIPSAHPRFLYLQVLFLWKTKKAEDLLAFAVVLIDGVSTPHIKRQVCEGVGKHEVA